MLYQSNSYSNINITLVETKKVSGTLLLPYGIRTQSDSKVTVDIVAQSDPYIIYDADPMRNVYFEKEVKTVIKKGKNIGKFEVELPVYSPGYYFNYKLNDYISGVCPDSANFITRTEVLEDTYVTIQLDAGKRGDNITPHHAPSAEYMKQFDVSKGDGLCINIEQPKVGDRHIMTYTYGRNMTDAEKAYYYSLSPRDALAYDLKNLRNIYKDAGLYKEMLPKLRQYPKKYIDYMPNIFRKGTDK